MEKNEEVSPVLSENLTKNMSATNREMGVCSGKDIDFFPNKMILFDPS